MRIWQKPCTRCMNNSLGAWMPTPCARHFANVLGAWYLFTGPKFSNFFVFLSLRLQIICRRTLEHNSSHFVSLLRPLESSFLFLESSPFFSCSRFSDFHDFFVNYFKNPVKLLCFGKTRITNSYIENITKVTKS